MKVYLSNTSMRFSLVIGLLLISSPVYPMQAVTRLATKAGQQALRKSAQWLKPKVTPVSMSPKNPVDMPAPINPPLNNQLKKAGPATTQRTVSSVQPKNNAFAGIAMMRELNTQSSNMTQNLKLKKKTSNSVHAKNFYKAVKYTAGIMGTVYVADKSSELLILNGPVGLFEKLIQLTNLQEYAIRNWENLSESKRDALVLALAENIRQGRKVYLFDMYEHANDQQKTILVTGIAESLKQGNLTLGDFRWKGVLVWIYNKSNELQKNILVVGIAEYLKQGKKIKGLYWIYERSTDQQKNILVPAIADNLKQDKKISYFEEIYRNSNTRQKDILLPAIIEQLNQGEEISSFRLIYEDSNDQQKNILVSAIVDNLKQGKEITYFTEIYMNSNEKQKNILLPAIVENLNRGKEMGVFYLIYGDSNAQQRDILLPAIVENLKQGNQITGLFSIYEDSNDQQKDILFSEIMESLKQDKEIDYLDRIYFSSNRNQRDSLLPELIKNLKKGGEIKDLFYIYRSLSDSKKNIFITEITEILKQGKIINDLSLIYQESNEEQRDILFPAIAENLKLGIEIENLYKIYINSTDEQKNILFNGIIEYLKLGKKVNGLYLIYKYSNDKQKNMLVNTMIEDMNLEQHLMETQTGKHILSNLETVLTEHGGKLDSHCKEVIREAVCNEHRLIQKGQYVFYHAQIWDIYWLELLYTKLWQLKHKKSAGNYIFTRFAKDSDCYENAQAIEKKRKIRKHLMERGRFDPYRPSLLFLNYALFGNSTNPGSSSAQYFLNNDNVSKPAISMKDIFEKFNLQDFYTKNKKIFDELEKEFSTLSSHGNLIQIAMPKEHVQKHLYLTTSGGPKKKATIQKDGNISEIDDVPELIEMLKKDPDNIVNSDRKEFVWIVTEDTVQKALHDGVEIRSFNTADPEKFAHVMQKLDALLEKVVQEDQRSAHPQFKSQATPWECYKQHKDEIAQRKILRMIYKQHKCEIAQRNSKI